MRIYIMEKFNTLFNQYLSTYSDQESYFLSNYILTNPDIFKKLKMKNTSESHMQLGYLYYLSGDFTNMQKYLLSAIKSGNTHAMLMYGTYHFKISDNSKELKKYYLMPKNSIGYALLGVYYSSIKNNTESEKYFKKSLDWPMAILWFGRHYLEFDVKTAKKYFDLSLKNNNKLAFTFIGKYYQRIGNVNEMMENYKMAMSYEHSDAMLYMGDYYYSIGKYNLMKKYYTMAGKYHNLLAIDKLAFYYVAEEQNDKLANKYMKIGIDSNYNEAYQTKGVYYKFKLNFAAAEKCLFKAIELGAINAYGSLSYVYEDMKNKKLQYKYLMKGIEKNAPLAMVIYAGIKYDENDYKTAIKYYTLATDYNYIFGYYYLGSYHQYITKNYELMEKYYFKVMNDIENAPYTKSWTYEEYGNHCRFVLKDYEKMTYYYTKAIELKNKNAKKQYDDFLKNGH